MPERLGLIAILLIVIAAIACGQSEPTPIPLTATPQIIVVTATPEPTPVPDVPTPQITVVTATSEPVSMPPIPQPTYTPYPTQTPFPTYTPYPTPTLMPTSIPTEIPTPSSVNTAVPTATSQPQTATGNIVTGPTNTPTATPEPMLVEGCVQSGEASEFVAPTMSNGTTKEVESLPDVIFQDTIPAYPRGTDERRAWVFRELSYQHCETEDPWKPEYFLVEGQEVEPPPWEQGEFVKMVFVLSLHERNESRDIVHESLRFQPHPKSNEWLRTNYPADRNSTFYLSDPDAVLYLWTNLRHGDQRHHASDLEWSCIIGDWDEDKGCVSGGWHWKAVSSGRWEAGDTWSLPLLKYHTPAVFAVVAEK